MSTKSFSILVKNNNVARKRSGISTIIGAVFFLITIISSMSVMAWTLQQQASFSTTTSEVSTLQLERQSSALEITEIKISNGKFNITLQNNGPLTERLVRLWATNETATNWHNKYDIDLLVNPKQVLTNIGQSLPLRPVNTDAYALKLVTERGNLITFRSLSVAQSNLALSLYVVPSTITSGENVTIIMSVNNNQRDVDSIHNLIPQLTYSSTCSGTCTITVKSTPSGIDALPRGSTALFKWIYNIQGPAQSTVTFTGTLQNAQAGNSASESVKIQPADTSIFADSAGTLSISYDSLEWSQNGGTTWQKGFSVPGGVNTAWRINFTNHDDRTLYLQDIASLKIQGIDANTDRSYYIITGIVGGIITPYNNVAPLPLVKDIEMRLYFGASAPSGTNPKNTPPANNQLAGFLLMFGTFTNPLSTNPADKYGQNIPFIAINTT